MWVFFTQKQNRLSALSDFSLELIKLIIYDDEGKLRRRW